MTGVEVIVSGWFASAVIGRFVNKAGDYLDSNRALHNDTKQMLDDMEDNLLVMKSILKKAAMKDVQDDDFTIWVRRIKDAAYEAKDVLDDFEAKRIRKLLESEGKSKVRNDASSFAVAAKNFILPDEDVKNLKAVVTKLEKLCKRSESFVESLQLDSGLGNTDCEEEPPNKSGILKKQIFLGRDSDVKFILTLILGYEIESLEHHIISDGTSHKVEFSLECTEGSEATSSLKCATVERPESIEMISDKEKSSSIDVGSAFKAKNVEPSTSQNNLQNRGTDPYGRPFVIPTVEVSELNDNVTSSSTDVGLGFKVKNVEPSTSEISAQNQNKDPNGRPFVIPIVGISGVGKTTLAQTIYDHQFLKDHFDLKEFIYMSGKSDIDKIVEALVASWGPNEKRSKYHEETKPFPNIEDKRFLLVLDDVSSINNVHLDVKRLCKMLSSGAYGSVILVTTQEHLVANRLGTINPIDLNPLEWNYFLQLLEYYAFFDANIRNDGKLHQICEYIGKKLPRIPLVARLIGSLLNSNINEDSWETISRFSWTYHIDKSIIPIIGKCFQDLNAKLKLCFAFCSIFPTNYIMERDRIIQMWVANDFIQTDPSDDSRLEDIGKMWFNELVNKSFFLSTPWPHKYIMHSTIRELARSILSREIYIFDENPNPCPNGCFQMVEHSDPCSHGYAVYEGPRQIPHTTRYLTLIRDNLAYEAGRRWYCNLHTLLCYVDYVTSSDKYCISMLKDTCKLRVLVLCYPGDGIKFHIGEIDNMSHLRFLDLSYTAIKNIPKSVCSLCHLQVLDIRGCKIQEVPRNMNHLINLRHLYASKETISLISGIGRLTNLQELEEFKISKKEGHTISELAKMNELGGHLSIVGLENIKDEVEAGEARMKEKKYLKVISLKWTHLKPIIKPNSTDNMEKANKILNSLQPHSATEELEIENFQGTELPSWTTLVPSYIRRIYLKSCHHLKNLPPFGRLPHLETLVLEDLTLERIGEELYGPGTPIFPELKVLKFVGMEKLEVWSPAGERELLPCLEELEIQNCQWLKETPLRSLELSHLKKLELSRCTRVLQEGGLSDKRLPLLNSLCISDNPSITLASQNVPNLTLLFLQWTDARFTGDGPGLSNLKSLILDNCRVPRNRGMILRSLTKLEMNGYLNEILEMSHSSLPSLKVLKLNCAHLYHVDIWQLEQREVQEYIDYIGDESERGLVEYTSQFGIMSVEKCTQLNEKQKCTQLNEKLSSWFKELPHLVELNLDIRGLFEFPSTLATLVSLKSLKLTGRVLSLKQEINSWRDTGKYITDLGVQSLPESGMPPNLKELYITGASDQLQQRCSKEQGEDWPKIKHIPYIRVNNRTLQMLEENSSPP